MDGTQAGRKAAIESFNARLSSLTKDVQEVFSISSLGEEEGRARARRFVGDVQRLVDERAALVRGNSPQSEEGETVAHSLLLRAVSDLVEFSARAKASGVGGRVLMSKRAQNQYLALALSLKGAALNAQESTKASASSEPPQ